MLEVDVLIAGAGPAGTATAARLVSHDLTKKVLVLDRYRFPRPKPCGGGLTGHADEVMAELGLELSVEHWPATDARVRYGSFERTIELGKPVNVVRREEFDKSLVDQIRGMGIEVVEGEGIRGYDVRTDGVEVHTTAGRVIKAAVLVGADGAASVVRKQLLGNPTVVPHRLFKHEMTLPADRPFDSAMVYDFTLMADGLRGYLWLFPVPGGLVNVGLMHYPSHRLGGRALTELLRRGLADHGVELPAKGTRGWPVWGYHPRTAISGPRVVTVGDAAGIDGLTGEGIAVAMEQAVIAGDAISRGLASGDLRFRDYRKSIRRAVVGRELNLDRHLSRLLYRCGADSQRWQQWLSLVLFDPEVLEMYAARVDGTEVLADHKAKLFKALGRHLIAGRSRRTRLSTAAAGEPADRLDS